MIQAFHIAMRPWNRPEVCETSYSPSEWNRVMIEAEKPAFEPTQHGVLSKKYFVFYNKRSGHVYNSFDPSFVVALKCAALFIATPLYITLRIVSHVLLFVVYDVCVKIIFHHIKYTFIDVNKGGYSISEAIAQHRSECSVEMVLNLLGRISSIFKLIYYFPGIMMAALGGALIDPYLGRHHISLIEKKLNCGATWNTDIRVYFAKAALRKKITLFQASFFLMHSFQPRLVIGNPIYDPFYKNVKITFNNAVMPKQPVSDIEGIEMDDFSGKRKLSQLVHA